METRRFRPWICLALCAMVVMFAAGAADAWLFGIGGKSKKRTPGVSKSLLVFPFDQNGISNLPETFGEYVASDVRTMMSSGSDYYVFLYMKRLAPIVRAQGDNSLKALDAEPPFAEDRTKAIKLAQLMSSDYLLIGAIDDYQVDVVNKVATVTLSAELVDVKTGRLVKTLLVTGRSPESAKTIYEDELRDIAKGDAVTRLMAELLSQRQSDLIPVPTPEAATTNPTPEPETTTLPPQPEPANGEVVKPSD